MGSIGGGGAPGGGDRDAGPAVPDRPVAVVADAAELPGPDAGDLVDAPSDAPTSPISGFALCVVCHGPEGAGTDKGPEIQHPVIDFSTFVIRNGRTHPSYKEPMPKFPVEQISALQLEGIFNFLAARPKPPTGAELYKDYCLNCHGADGKGGVTMRDISAQPVAAFIEDSRAGHHPGEFENRREYMPKWTAAELSDAELRLIFAYVDGL